VKVKTRAASTVERSQPTKKELAKQKRELDLFNKYKEQAK
jgi:vacuolar-type H+-ATPase subunit D/Vma8